MGDRLVLLVSNGYESCGHAAAVFVPPGVDLGAELTAFERLVRYVPPKLGDLKFDPDNGPGSYGAHFEEMKGLTAALVNLGVRPPEWEWPSDKDDILKAFAVWLERKGCRVVPFEEFGYNEADGRWDTEARCREHAAKEPPLPVARV